jgi:aminoglycoside phosphotransferase (APT) family kinase protein
VGCRLANGLPSDDVLAGALAFAYPDEDALSVVERRAQPRGTFPKEVVVSRTTDGRRQCTFFKYAVPRDSAYGHRRGIAYEADVYRRVLAAVPVSTPRFIGSSQFGDSPDDHWLALEYIEGSDRLRSTADLIHAAEWLGQFHATLECPRTRDELAFLISYDESYYMGWVHRTARTARQHGAHRVVQLCDRLDEHMRALVVGPETVIHGEFTVHNVVRREGVTYPTDWESAAIAAGEIDLMCLVEAWPAETVAACRAAYVEARWDRKPPPGFDARLLASELYLHCRWLGMRPDWRPRQSWRVERLEALATEIGVAE